MPSRGGAAGGWVDGNRMPVYNVLENGADETGGTDSASAIQSAIDTAALTSSGGSGNIVYLPQGTYRIGSQLKVKNKVRLVGPSRSACVLKPYGGFGSATGLVRLGDGAGAVFGCRLENLSIDA